MRKGSWLLVLFLIPTILLAHGNKPGKATLETSEGVIEVAYIAPELKGRNVGEMIKMPGANPWRLGADRATVISTPTTLTLGHETIPAGKYTLRAHLDDDGQWWLQFVEQESRSVAGKLRLDADMASNHEEHLVIAFSGSAAQAGIKI